MPALIIPYQRKLSFAYILAAELNQVLRDQNPHTYTTIAISEYKSHIVTIIRVLELVDYVEKSSTLRYENLKKITLGFYVNYSM